MAVLQCNFNSIPDRGKQLRLLEKSCVPPGAVHAHLDELARLTRFANKKLESGDIIPRTCGASVGYAVDDTAIIARFDGKTARIAYTPFDYIPFGLICGHFVGENDISNINVKILDVLQKEAKYDERLKSIIVPFSKIFESGAGMCAELALAVHLFAQDRSPSFLVTGVYEKKKEFATAPQTTTFGFDVGDFEFHCFNLIFDNRIPYLVDLANPICLETGMHAPLITPINGIKEQTLQLPEDFESKYAIEYNYRLLYF